LVYAKDSPLPGEHVREWTGTLLSDSSGRLGLSGILVQDTQEIQY